MTTQPTIEHTTEHATGTCDHISCVCGNDPTSQGFYHSTIDGQARSPYSAAPPEQRWDGKHVTCTACGRVYEQPTSDDTVDIPVVGTATAVSDLNAQATKYL
jgi:hypothetical protein